MRLLIERSDVDVKVKDNYESTPLTLAADFGHEAVVRILIERGES